MSNVKLFKNGVKIKIVKGLYKELANNAGIVDVEPMWREQLDVNGNPTDFAAYWHETEDKSVPPVKFILPLKLIEDEIIDFSTLELFGYYTEDGRSTKSKRAMKAKFSQLFLLFEIKEATGVNSAL